MSLLDKTDPNRQHVDQKRKECRGGDSNPHEPKLIRSLV